MKVKIVTMVKKQRGGIKKRHKTLNQQKFLQEFFQQYCGINGQWPKSQIVKLCETTELTQCKVYKWLWDKKNKMKKNLCQGQVKKAPIKKQEVNYLKFGIIQVQVPQEIKCCNKIMVQESCLSQWAQNCLQTQGWQLIMDQNIKKIIQTPNNDLSMIE